ncbi:MAG: MerR family transcriptional regulator [Planctomycetaceae bacterium]
MNEAPEGLLSIGDLAERSGISRHTIRVWERRYGKPEPIRLPSGHRRYTEDHLRWLRRVAEALARGHRPSALMALRDADIDRILVSTVAPARDEWVPAVLELVRGFREGELRKRIARGLGGGAKAFLAGRLQSLLEEVGRAWADGRLAIRHEHFLSEIVEGALRAYRAAHRPRRPRLRILLATLPGERHSIGIQMAAVAVEEAGAEALVLGVETPLTEIAAGARETKADAVAIGVSLAMGGIAADRTLAALLPSLGENVRLVAGGAGSRGPGRGARGVEYVDSLDALREWVRRS